MKVYKIYKKELILRTDNKEILDKYKVLLNNLKLDGLYEIVEEYELNKIELEE
jgi:hypothetical protein